MDTPSIDASHIELLSYHSLLLQVLMRSLKRRGQASRQKTRLKSESKLSYPSRIRPTTRVGLAPTALKYSSASNPHRILHRKLCLAGGTVSPCAQTTGSPEVMPKSSCPTRGFISPFSVDLGCASQDFRLPEICATAPRKYSFLHRALMRGRTRCLPAIAGGPPSPELCCILPSWTIMDARSTWQILIYGKNTAVSDFLSVVLQVNPASPTVLLFLQSTAPAPFQDLCITSFKMKSSIPLMALAALPYVAASPMVSTRGADVNPFAGYEFYASPHYTAEVTAAIANLNARGETALAAKAAEVAKVSTFIWISDSASVTSISGYLSNARAIQNATGKKQVVQIEVYNLPDRDCSAKASDGEFHLNDAGEARYEAFIKAVGSELHRFPDVQIVLQLETDSIGNLVTNLSVPKCGNAAPAHKRLLALAVALLQYDHVHIYLDGAHAGWLGWPGNIGPTADILSAILADAKAINPKAKVRGVATNVSNYNGLGNQPQVGSDELVYINNLAPLLIAKDYPAHFIVDQGRSGNQVAARSGGDWCNFAAAGFGPRPSTTTPSPYIDAIVWVKPGGECDGTSDTTAARYDAACGSATSLTPAPEAGSWFQEYFELLIKQASPAF